MRGRQFPLPADLSHVIPLRRERFIAGRSVIAYKNLLDLLVDNGSTILVRYRSLLVSCLIAGWDLY
jgi:hypothetical protein